MTPRCPVEVYRKMRDSGYTPDYRRGLRERAKEIKYQIMITRAAEEAGLNNQSLPPCCECHPEVFIFCRDTGMECKMFDIYVSSGTPQKHKCVARMEYYKKLHPEYERYCENPKEAKNESLCRH